MNNNDKDFLGTAPIGKLLLSLALPTITAQLINMLYNIVDRIYIGHIPEAGALADRRGGMYAADPDRIRFCSLSGKRWCAKSFYPHG